MGEAKAKSRSRAAVLEGEARCIYCDGRPMQIEHMPPKSMFKGKHRPKGMEFAACAACNNGTSAADLVAGFFARIRPYEVPNDWQIKEAMDRKAMMEIKAPGVFTELFRPDKSREVWRATRTSSGTPMVSVSADGPLLRAHLSVFSSKLGMALYREHVGAPLPMGGAVFTQWFLNAGLARQTADRLLKTLPVASTLRQGAFHVGEQFGYQYNCDNKSIVAALARFHEGLYVFTIAMSEPEKYGPFDDGPTSALIRPGELAARMPPKGERYWSTA